MSSAPLIIHTKDEIEEQISMVDQIELQRMQRRGWQIMDNMVRQVSGDTRLLKNIKQSVITLGNYQEYGFQGYRRIKQK